jgi:hypothetical protein
MKTTILVLLALLLAGPTQSGAQAQQPFIFKLYGGLFFPGNDQFHDVYKSNSEKIWGVGVSIPLGGFVFLEGDIGYFRASASLNPQIDSSASLEENIIHVGLLHKAQISRVLFIRTSAGVNYATIKQKYESPRSPEQDFEADKKLGYFAGVALQRLDLRLPPLSPERARGRLRRSPACHRHSRVPVLSGQERHQG